jgi:cleavage stimulation factor subunit 3
MDAMEVDEVITTTTGVNISDDDIRKLNFSKRIKRARDRVLIDRFDVEAWKALIGEIEHKKVDEVRFIYDEFFKVFPTAGRYWKIYAQREIDARNYREAEAIFSRSLKQCPNVHLWKCYLQYVEDKMKNNPGNIEEIQNAYDLAITQIGKDIAASDVWRGYINFINHNYEIGQKNEKLRAIYQRALNNPMHGIEGIWEQYSEFENELNEYLAKSFLGKTGSVTAIYKSTLTTYKDKTNFMDGISRNKLAVPPKKDPKEREQAALWKRLISYEKSNPQRLEPKDLYERVTFTYNQSLLCLYRYPEIWHDAAQYQMECGRIDDAIGVYERGLTAVEHSLLLYFSYADFLESQNKIADATKVYERLLEQNQSSLVYIVYMRFARRAIGIKAAQKIFFKARKSRKIEYHVYVAAANIEYYVNDDVEVARRIYELGMKKFFESIEFIMEYINFLFQINDQNNLRVLFEKVLQNSSTNQVPEIWNAFQKFQSITGNLLSPSNFNDRLSGINASGDPNGMFSLVQRYRFLDLWPCTPEELSSFEGNERVRKDVAFESFGSDVCAKPDMSKLVPYKPEMGRSSNSNIPPAVGKLISLLPQGKWDGPSVKVEELARLMLDSNIKPKLDGLTDRKRTRDRIDEPKSDIYKDRQARMLNAPNKNKN